VLTLSWGFWEGFTEKVSFELMCEEWLEFVYVELGEDIRGRKNIVNRVIS
jgi:hypothetical protein